MTHQQKAEIEKIAKEFASGFKDTIGEISGSGWLIADPLSGYLNFCGYKNKLEQIPAKGDQQQVLLMTFKDGTQFIPAGSDLKIEGATDWMWLPPSPNP